MVHFDNLEDEGTFYSLSTEYLEAARVLMATPPTKINFYLVIYNLLGHAAELALKSYLFKSGEAIGTLKKSGHDLGQLVELARGNGLIQDSLGSISGLSSIYKGKDLDYRKIKNATLPNQSQLLAEVQALQRTVFNHIARF